MKPGNYYVGDLCYVMDDEWDEVCSLTLDSGQTEGEYTLESGVKFAMYGTVYGDGEYQSNKGDTFPVDSGTIGCVLAYDVNQKALNEALESGAGHMIEFLDDFETKSCGGVIWFGEFGINTNFDDDYSEGSEEYY